MTSVGSAESHCLVIVQGKIYDLELALGCVAVVYASSTSTNYQITKKKSCFTYSLVAHYEGGYFSLVKIKSKKYQ